MVRRSGAARATALFETEVEATEKAREIARREGGVLYVHGRDGLIRARTSFENEPPSTRR